MWIFVVFFCFFLFFFGGGVNVQLFQICGNAGAFYWRFFWLVEPVEWTRKIQNRFNYFKYAATLEPFIGDFFLLVEPVEWTRKIQKRFNYFKYAATLEPFIGDFFYWWSRWRGRVKYKWRPKKTQKKTFYRFFFTEFSFSSRFVECFNGATEFYWVFTEFSTAMTWL